MFRKFQLVGKGTIFIAKEHIMTIRPIYSGSAQLRGFELRLTTGLLYEVEADNSPHDDIDWVTRI
jgi:hypothetical protein